MLAFLNRSKAFLAVALAFAVLTVDQIFLHRDPMTLELDSMKPDPVTPGTYAQLYFHGTQRYACRGVVTRWIIDSDGKVYDIPSVARFAQETQFPDTFALKREVKIPEDASAGPATLHTFALRYCNVLQWLFYPITENRVVKFNIGAKP